ncbi:hypothetical protein AB2908_24580, partial [Escherichia coli]
MRCSVNVRANSWSLRPCCMVLAYRVAHFCSVWHKKNVLNDLWAAPLLVLLNLTQELFEVIGFRNVDMAELRIY